MVTQYSLVVICVALMKIDSVEPHQRHSSNRQSCSAGHFRVNAESECQPCTKCPFGYGALHPCVENRDTFCTRCIRGETFSRVRSYQQACHVCSTCEHREVKRRCHPNRNTQCGKCNDGWYMDPLINRCEQCSYCYPDEPGRTMRLPECNVPGIDHDHQCLSVMMPI